MATGMSACNAILLALVARDRLGRGQHVEVALFDIAVAMTGFYGMTYLITGVNQSRFGNSPNGSPTVGIYEAADAPFYMACANDRLVKRLMVEVLERPDLVTDPQFATRKARSLNKEKLRSLLNGIFKGDTRENWIARMKKVHVPVGYLRTIEEAFNSPEVRERHRVSQIAHPTAGTIPNIESPLHMGLTSIVDPVAAPLLGQHTNDVLRKTLGYDDGRIARLAEAGVFGATSHKV
jgi:crotonobetainyl-CoA:carnitine CoA-transferase CaiB-like acyl-CoA transferase